MSKTTLELQEVFLKSITDAYPGKDVMFYPKWIIANLNPLLTTAERDVLNVIIFETYGQSRVKASISHSQFKLGVTKSAGAMEGGTGLGKNNIIQSLIGLMTAKAIMRTRKANTAYGEERSAEYAVQPDERWVDYEWLEQRLAGKMAYRRANAKKSMEAKAKNKAAREAKGA